MGSKKYSLGVDDFKLLGGNLLKVAAGAALTYLGQWSTQTDWGIWSGLAIPAIAGLIDLAHRYLPDTSK